LDLASPSQTENTSTVVVTGENVNSPITAIFDADELAFELGLWLGGLESFVTGGDVIFADRDSARSGTRDCTREARITHAALLLCSKLNLRLRRGLDGLPVGGEIVNTNELDDLCLLIRDNLLLNESHVRSVLERGVTIEPARVAGLSEIGRERRPTEQKRAASAAG
jgi:hypothetical protein